MFYNYFKISIRNIRKHKLFSFINVFGLSFSLSICLIITSFTYDYQDVLFRPTQSIHQWRQCDCLSITMNYYQDNNPFLQPSVHYLGADGTGKTISECPLIYYSVASLWKVFGHHEFIYRMLVLLIYFIGLFSVFKLFENKLKDSIWAMICSLLLFTDIDAKNKVSFDVFSSSQK